MMNKTIERVWPLERDCNANVTGTACGVRRLHATDSGTGLAQHRDSEYRYAFHGAHAIRRWRSGRRGARICASRFSRAAGLLPMPPKNDLHPQIFGQDRESARTPSRRCCSKRMPGYYLGGNLYRPMKPAPARRLPGDRLAARALELRAAGAFGDRLGAGALHQSGAAGLRRLLLRHGGLQRHDPDAARFRQSARNSSGTSGRSACSCGTRSARWISCNRCPA